MNRDLEHDDDKKCAFLPAFLPACLHACLDRGDPGIRGSGARASRTCTHTHTLRRARTPPAPTNEMVGDQKFVTVTRDTLSRHSARWRSACRRAGVQASNPTSLDHFSYGVIDVKEFVFSRATHQETDTHTLESDSQKSTEFTFSTLPFTVRHITSYVT